MKRDMRAPQARMLGALCVALAALWLVALYGTYEESKREKYDVRVSPGAVTYGTHSMATIPMTSVATRRSAVPMISGGAVRNYAHYGHATMPNAASGSSYRVHTLSSATVHTIGSGGGGGGVGGASSSSSSSRGISYSGVSVSLPTLAFATPTRSMASSYSMTGESATSSEAPIHSVGLRRTPGYDGSREGEQREEGGKYWIWDGEEWIEAGDIPVGTTKIEGGITYRWNGSAWEIVGDQQDPGLPIGDAPWLWMLLLMAVYGGAKVWKRNKTKNLI